MGSQVGLLREGRMVIEEDPAVILERLCGPSSTLATTTQAEDAVDAVEVMDDGAEAAEAGEARPPPALEAAMRRLCELLDARAAPDAPWPPLPVRRRASCPACLPAARGQRGHPDPAPLRMRHKLSALLWKNTVYLWRHRS